MTLREKLRLAVLTGATVELSRLEAAAVHDFIVGMELAHVRGLTLETAMFDKLHIDDAGTPDRRPKW